MGKLFLTAMVVWAFIGLPGPNATLSADEGACENCEDLAVQFLEAGMDPAEAIAWLVWCLELWDCSVPE